MLKRLVLPHLFKYASPCRQVEFKQDICVEIGCMNSDAMRAHVETCCIKRDGIRAHVVAKGIARGPNRAMACDCMQGCGPMSLDVAGPLL